MSYLSGSYLSGESTLTQSEARDIGFAQATSQKQIANYHKYYKIVQGLSPQARQNLLINLNNLLESLPSKQHNLIMEMSLRTMSYEDPRAVVGLGQGPAAAATSTASTIAAITGIMATLATVGLQVAQVTQQRKQNKAAAEQQQQSEALNQQMLRTQLKSLKDEAAARKAAQQPQPQIGPNGELIIPSDQSKTKTAAVVTGIALTGAAAYMLTQ
jgi:hypothetical protein